MCSRAAAAVLASVYMPENEKAQLTTESGAGSVCISKEVTMPKESAAPRRV